MDYMNVFDKLFEQHPCLEPCKESILQAFNILKSSYDNNGMVLACGNGGSAADSEHIIGELMKGFKLKRPIPQDFKVKLAEFDNDGIGDCLQGALPAISLVGQSALISAMSNDIGWEYAFAQQVYGYGRKGDVLIAISTSGNAKNVLYACRVAKAIGMSVIGMSGETGGAFKSICDVCITVPYRETALIQEKHLPIYHTLCAALEVAFFDS